MTFPLTWLYVPGDRPDRFDRAMDSGADTVIIDLEDAVALPRKAYARDAAVDFLRDRHDLPVYVRLNDLTGPEVAADLAALAGVPGLAGFRLPKVQSAGQVRAFATELTAWTDRALELHCLIESAAGVEAAHQIATANRMVSGIGLGEADLSADLNVADEQGLTWSRSRIVVAARAAQLPPPAMSVYPHLADTEGLAASCRLGRQLGFLGRTAIHPKQLPVIRAAFQPSSTEVDKARELLAAMETAQTRDSGTAVLPDGRFADRAMIQAATRTIALADRKT